MEDLSLSSLKIEGNNNSEDIEIIDYYTQIFLSDVIMNKIIKFCGLIDSLLSYSVTSKGCRMKFIRLERINHEEGGILLESSGRLFSDIMNIARLSCVETGNVTISKEAKKFLSKVNNTFELSHAGLHEDLMMIKGSMFSHWNGFPHTPTLGVLHSLCETAKLNPEFCDIWEAAIDSEVKYWKDSKIFSDFHVLFERRDGTILIENETKKVYLVLGISQSIGELFYSSKRANLCFRNAAYQDLFWTGSVIGQKVTTTLINFDGRITYDGSIMETRSSKSLNLRQLLKIYKEAADKGAIISSLPKHLESPAVAVPSPDVSNFPEDIKKMLKEIMITPSDRIESFFVFRRHGYTEKLNPLHGITVMGLGGAILPYSSTINLVPSVEEYISLLSRAIYFNNKKKPGLLLVDALEQVENLKNILIDYGINVKWYTPPDLAEEKILHSRDPNKPFKQQLPSHDFSMCLQCYSSTAPDGGPLKQCSRCRKVKYCCIEHQKLHWRKHKRDCFPCA